MGRKKISITRLTDERNRQITFSKRKAGLLKKAYELSILCDVEIAVIMITSNSKLYQYASSNMNSILIRYTDFKDPDESKTNADILDDITKKDKGAVGQDDSADEESSAPATSFMVTPRTQENFRRIDKEFDHLIHTNQVPAPPPNAPPPPAATPLGSAPPNIPSVMPVTVPVGMAASPGTVHQQIQQHLQSQLEGHKMAALSATPVHSVSSSSTLFSPQSDLSSNSPMSSARGPRSPSSLPTPLTTPTRLQTLRNQTLKLHLPGSGRNYISLSTGGSGSGGGGEGLGYSKRDGEEDGEEGRHESDEGRPGTKPQLRVFIPGQKEFVPRVQETSPLSQVTVTSQHIEADGGVGGRGGGVEGGGVGGGGVGAGVALRKGAGVSVCTSVSLSTNTESLTTPVLSLTTPNVFSSLPPIFSSLLGDFPFNPAPPVSSSAANSLSMSSANAGDKDSSSAALVAFPVSIQPSATGSGGTNAGNLILQAQNMGQPFLLTPTYDSRQNPLLNSQGYATPPPSSGLGPATGGISSSGMGGNLEQLKQHYERTQQLIQQQLLYTQMQMLHQQQSKEGGGAEASGSSASTTNAPSNSVTVTTGVAGGRSPLLNSVQTSAVRGSVESGHSDNRIILSSSVSTSSTSSHPSQFSSDGGGDVGTVRSLPQFINGSDVMISSLAMRKSPRQMTQVDEDSGGRGSSETLPPAKKSRLDSSPITET